jgi:hypothetical protein
MAVTRLVEAGDRSLRELEREFIRRPTRDALVRLLVEAERRSMSVYALTRSKYSHSNGQLAVSHLVYLGSLPHPTLQQDWMPVDGFGRPGQRRIEWGGSGFEFQHQEILKLKIVSRTRYPTGPQLTPVEALALFGFSPPETLKVESVKPRGVLLSEARSLDISRHCPTCLPAGVRGKFEYMATEKSSDGKTVKVYRCINCRHELEIKKRGPIKRGAPSQKKAIDRIRNIVDDEKYTIEEMEERPDTSDIWLRVVPKSAWGTNGLLRVGPTGSLRFTVHGFGEHGDKKYSGSRVWDSLSTFFGIRPPSLEDDFEALMALVRKHSKKEGSDVDARRKAVEDAFAKSGHLGRYKLVNQLTDYLRDAGVKVQRDKRKRIVVESLNEADRGLRELERAFESNPKDMKAMLNLRMARIRAGLPAWTESMARALGHKPLILHSNGRLQRVTGIKWLLRNWRDHDSFVVEDLGRRGAMMRVRMQDGRWYETPFASRDLLWDWINRPVFRGSNVNWMGFHTIAGGPRPPGVTAYKSHEIEKHPSGVGYRRVR